jgi:hypothetical protein
MGCSAGSDEDEDEDEDEDGDSGMALFDECLSRGCDRSL